MDGYIYVWNWFIFTFANFEIDLFAQPTPSNVSTEPEEDSKLASESALFEIIIPNTDPEK